MWEELEKRYDVEVTVATLESLLGPERVAEAIIDAASGRHAEGARRWGAASIDSAGEIADIHEASGGTYGAHRVTAELRYGMPASVSGIVTITSGRPSPATRGDPAGRSARASTKRSP